MSLISRLLEQRSTEISLSLHDPALVEIFGGHETASGVRINEHNSLTISAVYTCVNIISQTLASLPLVTYRRLKGGGKERATDHPVYALLKDRPNDFQTSAEFRQLMQAFLLTWGNAFAAIELNGAGQPINLWPWRPDRVRLQLYQGRLWYYYNDPLGFIVQLPQERVFHVRGLGGDGFLGYSVISLQRESLGLCQAAQEYRARFFANDARPGGVLQHPGNLSEPAFKRLKESWAEMHSRENKQRFALLEEGLQWKDVGIPPNDAQFLEGWVASREEVCGIYRVPPHKAGIMKPGTVSHSSVEQSNLDFWCDCIRTWAVFWEQRANVCLFTDAERRQLFVEHLADAILRADTKSRFDAYAVGRQWGWLSADDIRDLENLNPLPNGAGASYWMPANFTTAAAAAAVPAGQQPDPATQQTQGD